MTSYMQRGIALASTALLLILLPKETPAGEKYRREEVSIAVPAVTLIDQDGREVLLPDLLAGERPVIADFVYATCTTICPVLSAGFANFQKRLGAEARSVLLVSFSIDPEHDTPEVMRKYLERYRAGPGWLFLTGRRDDIDKTMRAFDAYVSNKMSHRPLTFLKAPGKETWLRLDGLMGTSDLVGEYRELTGTR